jgi:hypothetical protein
MTKGGKRDPSPQSRQWVLQNWDLHGRSRSRSRSSAEKQLSCACRGNRANLGSLFQHPHQRRWPIRRSRPPRPSAAVLAGESALAAQNSACAAKSACHPGGRTRFFDREMRSCRGMARAPARSRSVFRPEAQVPRRETVPPEGDDAVISRGNLFLPRHGTSSRKTRDKPRSNVVG